jgi:RNA polymerase sigma factor (sigma-70 family)
VSEQLFLAQLDLIERAIAAICRRQRLPASEAEEFAGTVRLHLIDRDYAVLRKFQGRSSIKTYLIAVITHCYQDWRNAQWGKWRPSVEAKRQGPIAVRLEQLIVRDGLTLDEACETLRTNLQLNETRQELESMAVRFPARPIRRFVSEEALDQYPDQARDPDATLRERDSNDLAARALDQLAGAIRGLAGPDRFILRMRFEDDLSIADIARVLHLDAKPLYRRIERMLGDLRQGLEDAGLPASAVADLIADGGFGRTPRESGDGSESRRGVRLFSRGGSATQNARTP